MTSGTDEENSPPPGEAAGWSGESSTGVERAKGRKDALVAIRRADSAHKHELLFEAWDEGEGFASFAKVALGIKELQPSSDEIHLQYTAEAACKALPQLDLEDDQRLNRTDFHDFVERLTAAMGTPLTIVAELLILSAVKMHPGGRAESGLIMEKVQEHKKHAQHIAALSEDERVERLFTCFNKSGSGQISFSELSHMLHQLRRGVSLQEARAQAVSTMLLCDTDSKRALGRGEFARFLSKLAVLLHVDAANLADTLLQIALQGGTLPSVSDSATALSMDSKDTVAQVYETLADRKLHLLFELWDKDGDGHISFAELALGIRKFSSSSESVTEAAADAAETMLLFDVDMDQKLDRMEFARFVNHFCEACGTDFNTLSEFLILLAALEDNPSEELAFLLSEDKVDRAVSDLASAWRRGVNRKASGAIEETPENPTPRTNSEGVSSNKDEADVVNLPSTINEQDPPS